MYLIDDLPGYIDLGQLSEKGAKEIEFDVTEWLTAFPTGTFSISYIRPTETTVYPVAAGDVTTATALGVTTLTWAISDTVTAIAGAGSMVVQLAVADTVVKRSRLVQTIVQEGHSAAGDPPEPVADWIADATSKLAEVDHFVDETIDATIAANAAALRAESGEDDREQAEGLRVIAEQGRHDAYGLAESTRDGLYEAAEIARDELFESAETTRNTQSGEATDRANAIAGTLEGIAPLWSGVDISASALGEGAAPTASITQGETGTSISLGIPKGDTGAQGPIGNVMYATFDIDFDTGELVMTIPDGYTGPTFSINDETGELEVSI